MNLQHIGKTPDSTNKTKIDFRLRTYGCKKKDTSTYTSWKLFDNDNVFIRTYDKYIEVRMFTDLNDAYLVKTIKYSEFTFECDNETLIKQFIG